MSLITRCPACTTIFNVVTDQLKVSHGWVRCGQCAEVFDASLNLQPERKSEVHPANADPDLVPPALLQPEPGIANINLSAAPRIPERPSEESKIKDIFAAAATSQAGLTTKVTAQAADKADGGADIDDPPVEVSFVREARRQAFWRKPLVRVLLASTAMLLTLLLAAQFAFHQRASLEAYEPRLKPLLQMLCNTFSCDIGAVLRIEALVIDSSTFTKISDGAYRLVFSIKNKGGVAVAPPSLEVTLTDNQDQAVIRRVFAPSQFGFDSALLAANSEFAGVLNLRVVPPDSARVEGYRLLAFYP